MKTKYFSFVIALILLIAMSACKKEKTNELKNNADQINLTDIKLISYSNGQKSATPLLEFSSIAAYEATMDALRQALFTHDSLFLAQYGYLDEEALNAKEAEIGYTDELPLMNLENSLNFISSMRRAFKDAEADWLNNATLDPATDPSITYSYENVEMALLNSDGEVKIGGQILKLTVDGFVWITNADFNTLIAFNNGDMSTLTQPNVVTNITETSGSLKSTNSGECTWWREKNLEDPYATNRKVFKHVHFHAYPWKGVSQAEITSYKKTAGLWFKYRMQLGVKNQTFFKDNDCYSFSSESSPWKRENAKSIDVSIPKWGAFPGLRAKNGESVYGQFEYAGYSNSFVLSW